MDFIESFFKSQPGSRCRQLKGLWHVSWKPSGLRYSLKLNKRHYKSRFSNSILSIPYKKRQALFVWFCLRKYIRELNRME